LKLNEADSVEQEKVRAVPVLDAFLVIVVTFFLVFFLGAFLYIVVGEGPALVLSELIILFIPLGYLLFKHIDIKRYVGLDVNPKLVLLGLASGALLLFVDVIVSAVLTYLFGVSEAIEQSNTLITDLSSTTWGLITVAMALGLAGICEEFAFRGFLQSTLTRRYSFIPALITSAFVFGLFHFDPQLVYILSALTAGLVLGYVYHHWNSYVVSAIAHSTVNLVVLATLLLLS
jgi:membrane protease YdiL (CAAX protease family)